MKYRGYELKVVKEDPTYYWSGFYKKWWWPLYFYMSGTMSWNKDTPNQCFDRLKEEIDSMLDTPIAPNVLYDYIEEADPVRGDALEA